MTEIVPLDRYNWEQSLAISVAPDQRAFLPSILHSLAQSKFENLTPMGVLHHAKMVGFLMYGEFSGLCWINRIMIDQQFQGQGIGKAALSLLLEQLKRKRSCREIRTSYAIHNEGAANLFRSVGFRANPDPIDQEIVAVYIPKTPTSV